MFLSRCTFSFKLPLIAMTIAIFSFPVSAISSSASNHKAMAREIFKNVVAMDTSVIGNQTPKMASYLAKLFKDAGFASKDVMEIPITATQTSLIVRYRGSNTSAKAIGFLAHMDVVTALRKDWQLDPFTLTERDGFFIGRGTADNKAGIVGLSSTFIKLKKSGYVPNRTLVLIFTSDEETGMVSAQHIANNMVDEINIEYGINADALSGILTPDGEVFGYYVQGAEKSPRTVELTVKNPGGHSSAPRADNAIYQLAHALIKVENYKFPVIINEISAGMLTFAAKRATPEVAAAIKVLLANPADKKAAALVSQDPNIATVIRTTCVATKLDAGHASNALPQTATATVNCRIMPGVAPKDVYAQLNKVIGDSGVVLKAMREQNTIAPASPMREDVMKTIKFAMDERYPNTELIPFMASYATDGMHFRTIGIPVYGSSGIFMDPSQAYAHGLNEKISVAGFYDSLIYWERLMKRLTSAK